MRAFVTGGTGFLGTHLIEALEQAGWDIIALHRPDSDTTRLRAIRRLELACGDVTDAASLRRCLPDGVDAVFNVAGSAGLLPHNQEHRRYAINHLGTRNVLAACRERRIGRLIHTSTIATYDNRAPQPLSEASPPNDWSRDAYIHSKRLADLEVASAVADGLDAVILHPCAIIGAYDKDTWSKAFREIQAGLPFPFSPPGGLNVGHAGAVARAHLAAFHHGRRNGHYILAGPAVSLHALFQEIARQLGRPGPRLALPAPLFKPLGWAEFLLSSLLGREPTFTPHTIRMLSERMFADGSLAERELGYRTCPLPEMVAECRAWMTATGRLPPAGVAGRPRAAPFHP